MSIGFQLLQSRLKEPGSRMVESQTLCRELFGAGFKVGFVDLRQNCLLQSRFCNWRELQKKRGEA